jgi:Flp pilus assembly protein TadG
MLAMMMLGVIDFGMAFAREMSMSNAVRAGTQFALTRHPTLGPQADQQDALVSLQNIRDVVIDAAPFLETDPGNQSLEINVYCECDDGSSTPCTSSATTPMTCSARMTLLQIKLTLPYSLLFDVPGIDSDLTLSTEHTIRLT